MQEGKKTVEIDVLADKAICQGWVCLLNFVIDLADMAKNETVELTGILSVMERDDSMHTIV